ncbi:hypothetical protein ACJIZ3_012713 [Penstemon smallii]|uniref:Uncharacterized protein n=1 Tax=Penstemon smallii TaxID=265156 RepID=A0ABD3UPY4_9LAMI
MAFYGYKGDVDECYQTPYSSAYNDFEYSSYTSGEPEFCEYNSFAYYRNDSYVTSSEPNYSVYTYSEPQVIQYDPIYSYDEPKLLQYKPSSYDQCYFPSEIKFTISYSKVVEFNEPDFEDYDPTPYGGGYDPATTYGKPLPPSDQTCYPRSIPDYDGMSLANFSYGSIPSPYGKDDNFPSKPSIVKKPIDTKTDVPETSVGNGDKATSEISEKKDVIPSNDSPSNEDVNGYENGVRGGYVYESSDSKVPQISYGSGLEAMDICESIFGHWPCLAKIQQQERDKKMCDQERRDDPWKSVADYLFGNPVLSNYE